MAKAAAKSSKSFANAGKTASERYAKRNLKTARHRRDIKTEVKQRLFEYNDEIQAIKTKRKVLEFCYEQCKCYFIFGIDIV